MEPRIQYCTTSDGVRIAFCVEGEGRPLVAMSGWPWTHLRAELTVPTYRLFHELLAAHTKYVRFDMRGTGLSERNPASIALDDRVLDLEAVVDHLGFAQFDAWAWGPSGSLPVAYAARHPDRLRRLVLWDCTPQMEGGPSGFPRLEAIIDLMNKDWELFSETAASVMFGWSAGEEARVFARYLREAVSQEMAVRATQQMFTESVRELIPAVTMPALVMQFRNALGTDVDMGGAAELTSLLPNASMAVIDGTWISTEEAAHKAAETVLEFLMAGDGAPTQAVQGGTVTILFTDLASSTALTQRLGDAKAQELVRAHNTIVREALKESGGTEIKHTGDGIMASFPTASGALECAVAIQRAVTLRAEDDLQVHIGLNAGEPVAEESDLFGTSVQLARRICDHAEAGQVLTSNVVRELAAGKGFLFGDIGEVVAKGFEEPVRLYEVRWRE
ncbi:MAG: adenylate/guanylate cyclase domain-containing protein [Dehalococcoidia bacterium]